MSSSSVTDGLPEPFGSARQGVVGPPVGGRSFCTRCNASSPEWRPQCLKCRKRLTTYLREGEDPAALVEAVRAALRGEQNSHTTVDHVYQQSAKQVLLLGTYGGRPAAFSLVRPQGQSPVQLATVWIGNDEPGAGSKADSRTSRPSPGLRAAPLVLFLTLAGGFLLAAFLDSPRQLGEPIYYGLVDVDTAASPGPTPDPDTATVPEGAQQPDTIAADVPAVDTAGRMHGGDAESGTSTASDRSIDSRTGTGTGTGVGAATGTGSGPVSGSSRTGGGTARSNGPTFATWNSAVQAYADALARRDAASLQEVYPGIQTATLQYWRNRFGVSTEERFGPDWVLERISTLDEHSRVVLFTVPISSPGPDGVPDRSVMTVRGWLRNDSEWGWRFTDMRSVDGDYRTLEP